MNIKPGTRIRLQVDNTDHDENDNPRIIPAGSVGTITEVYPELESGRYSVLFDNGGWLFFSAPEIEPLIA